MKNRTENAKMMSNLYQALIEQGLSEGELRIFAENPYAAHKAARSLKATLAVLTETVHKFKGTNGNEMTLAELKSGLESLPPTAEVDKLYTYAAVVQTRKARRRKAGSLTA